MKCPGCGSRLSFGRFESVVECAKCKRHICRLGAVEDVVTEAKPKIVFFNGSFDGINAGHVRAMGEIKEKYSGSRLIIGLNSDALMEWMIASGCKSQDRLVLPFDQRREILSHVREVDEIVETHEPQAIRQLQALNADVYVLTEEWTEAQKPAIDWIRAKGGEVYYSPRYEDILCNSDIRRRIIGGGI